MANTIHVTRISGRDVYGHADSCCNEAGCNGTEQYFGAINLDDAISKGDMVKFAAVRPADDRAEISSISLREYAASEPGGEHSRWRIEGSAEHAEVLYYPDNGRAGVAWGADATWVDADSALEAVKGACAVRVVRQ